eukprot:6175935-Pleurochrysis_carterae.AAC.10
MVHKDRPKVRRSPQQGKAKAHIRQKNLGEMLRSRRSETGMGVGERKRRSTTAPAVRAREVCMATAYGRRPGRLLKRLRHYLVLTRVSSQLPPVLSSDRHVLRHIIDCRFSTLGNLHRDVDLAARRAADLARTQLSGY